MYVYYGHSLLDMHWSWKCLLNLGFGRVLSWLLRKGFGADDKEKVEKCRIQLMALVNKMEQDWLGTYLCMDPFCAHYCTQIVFQRRVLVECMYTSCTQSYI